MYRHYRLFNELKQHLYDLVSHTDSKYPFELRWSDAREGSIKFTDAYVMKQILHKYKPATILEVGSFLGFSTRWLLEITKGWTPKITAIDPNLRHRVFDEPRSVVERLNSQFYPERLEIVTGFFGTYDDSVYHDYEHYEPKIERKAVDELINRRVIIDEAWNRKFDFIFIDGNHAYESVMNNFETAIGILNNRGTIAFHDALSWMGVNRAVKEIKVKYHDEAEVNIYGNIDRAIFKSFGVHIDGIGSFRLLN